MPEVPGTAPGLNLGFLSVVQEPSGYVGAYLVTNEWGRPLEFRMSSAVQPNRVQQILYGNSLPGFLVGELIGKTLVEKAAVGVRLIVTENPHALDLRFKIDAPVLLYTRGLSQFPETTGYEIAPHAYCHPRFETDAPVLREFLNTLGHVDLSEPFQRIREALVEARKLGVHRFAA